MLEKIVDLTKISTDFPELKEPQIPRDNLIDTLEDMLESLDLVIVEGKEGIGKTTLLAQFVKRHKGHAISIFIRPASRYTYDPANIQFEFCNQMHWILYKDDLQEEEASESLMNKRLMELSRLAKHHKENFYFVVDGLYDIPDRDSHIREILLSMLPLGSQRFRFLISGNADQFPKFDHRIRYKSFPISGLPFEQTVKYFEESYIEIEQQSVQEIWKTCRGNPAYLASIRRLLLPGEISIQALMKELPTKLPELFEIEWRKVDEDNEKLLHLLAILAHDYRTYSIEKLSRLVDIEPSTINESLKGLEFIDIDERSSQVRFVSEAFRQYAAGKLRHLEQSIIELIIKKLLGAPDSEEALSHLPGYLERTGQFQELLSYLSLQNFAKMLAYSQSLAPIQQKVSLGITAAQKLGRDYDVMRFSLQKSIMADLDGAKVWRSEIEALMALDDYESALSLAQGAMLKEERLELLAIIAKAKREQGLSPEEGLLEQIHQIYNQIDKTTLGERAVDIASDLISVDPDLAIEIIEKATNTEANEDSMDWAFAKLSLNTLVAHRDQSQFADTVETIRARIKDPAAQSFSCAASLVFGDYSADEVIAEVKKLDDVRYSLYLLRLWSIENREREDAAQVVEYALKLAIGATEYPPNARAFRELATPLPYISDEAILKQLVNRFDGQQGDIEISGPTEEYVRLLLILAQAESKYGFEAARNRVTEIYLYIVDIDDLAIKTGCMARLMAALPKIDPEMKIEAQDQIYTYAEDDLKSDTERLLEVTAEQYDVTRNTVKGLAKAKPEMAFECITKKLNTEDRRDISLSDLIKSAIQVSTDRLDLNFINQAINQFVDIELRDKAIFEIMARLSVISEKNEALTDAAIPIIDRIKDIEDTDERCGSCCFAYSFLVKQDAEKYSEKISQLLRLLQSSWEAVDVEWDKVNIGFKITKSLGKHTSEIALSYLTLTEKFRENAKLDTPDVAQTYLLSLRLAIRAYSGLIKLKLNSRDRLERLNQLITNIASSGERARLWTDLALYHYIYEQSDECKRIVDEYVRPLLKNISDTDKNYKDRVIITVVPALYCTHQRTTVELVETLTPYLKNDAYAQICKFILRKQPLSEPYETLYDQGYKISYQEIIDLCDLLERMENDSKIYFYIKSICDSIDSKYLKDRIAREQKSDIVNRLNNLIDVKAKLPDLRNIQHEGYKIAAKAQLARLQKTSPQDWSNLCNSARNIGNIADQAFVLCIIAVAMPNKQREQRKQLLKEAKELVSKIPATLDRIGRYEDMASMARTVEPMICKECLQLAIDEAFKNDSPEFYPVQRRIIDLAHMLDTDLSSSLASLTDDDPARIRRHDNLRHQSQMLDLKKKLANQTSEDFSSVHKGGLAKAAWRLLGDLNADRFQTFHLDYARKKLLYNTINLPFSESYPILALFIENAIQYQHPAQPEQASKYLVPLFEATVLGTEIVQIMMARSVEHLKQAKNQAIQISEGKDSLIVRPGERDKAVQFIADWIEHEVKDYLTISDPYFGLEDLEVLKLVLLRNPKCTVKILTSEMKQKKDNVQEPWKQAYRNYWENISEPDPPFTDIFIIGTKTGKTPIHDRWWITDGGGLEIGTSFSGLGKKVSKITKLSSEEAKNEEKEIEQYLQRNIREHEGEKLYCDTFTL